MDKEDACKQSRGSGGAQACCTRQKPGSGRMLSESQELAIRQIICDKRPEQLKMEFALWNRAAKVGSHGEPVVSIFYGRVRGLQKLLFHGFLKRRNCSILRHNERAVKVANPTYSAFLSRLPPLRTALNLARLHLLLCRPVLRFRGSFLRHGCLVRGCNPAWR